MTEQENAQVSIETYKSVFPTPASEDSLAKAIVATRSFPSDSEKDILTSAESLVEPNTQSLWSIQDAKEQRNLIFGSVVKHIAGSKNFSGICDVESPDQEKFNPNFSREVLTPIENWKPSSEISQTDAEEIRKMKQRAEESISGVLWGLYKEDLTKFVDEYHFARFMFPKRDYTIRPDSINTGEISNIKAQLKETL